MNDSWLVNALEKVIPAHANTMYSPYFFCFYLRFDAGLSRHLDIERIKGYLRGVDQIRAVDPITYESVEAFPGIRLILLHARSCNSWASSHSIRSCNLMYVEGAKAMDSEAETNQTRHARYVELLKKTADVLGWEVVEEDEEGIEDFVRYQATPLAG